MRRFFFFPICILFFLSECIASDPATNFISSEKISYSKDSILHNQFLLGLNFSQAIAGDLELHAMYRFRKRYSIMAGAGYDFNLLDFGRPLKLEDQCTGCNLDIDGQSKAIGRYFWGNGVAFRLVVTDTYADNNVSHFFLSLYSVMKYRNYRNYYFGDGGEIHSESANQEIFGMGFYVGYEVLKKYFLLRPYGGLGFRSLDSKIFWPAIFYGHQVLSPQKNFAESTAYPALDVGIIFLFHVRR